MQMKHVSSLFDRYRTLLVPPQASVEKRTAEIICELTPLQVTASQITYSVGSRTLSLQVPSVVKSELQRHKSAILAQLEKEMGVKNSPKTIF